jgi:serine phosphatase RsbU (regulator of sigma subunit)
LFIVDRRAMNPAWRSQASERSEGSQRSERSEARDRTGDRAGERTGERRGERPPRQPITILGPLPPELQKYGLDPGDIAGKCRDWLAGVGRPTISHFQEYDTPQGKVGLNLICVPVSERHPRAIVAAVNILTPQSKFMDKVNTDADSTTAVLLDDEGTIMVTASPDQVGRRVMDILEEEFKPLARQYLGTGKSGTELINRSHRMGTREYPPGLFTIEPVRVADKRWTLMMISPLADVDLVVSRIFQKAVFWAVFVVCSMTAILLSTSLQLIRGRARMERLRNDVLTRELTQAREIQLAWLPRDKITVPQIDIAAINHPASHISGDFYDWFELPDGRTVVTIGDVTGHGMGAAFLMATTQLLVQSTMLRLQDPGKTLREVNDQLTRQIFSGQFVTMLICVLDVDRGRLEISTAGHQAPIIGDNGRFVPLPIEYHLVLGIEKDVEYKTERYDLAPSASLILFTDGVTDARAVDGQRFDTERLIETLNAARAESAQQLIDSIVGRINQFRQTRELPDDLTLVCIQTLGERAFRASEALSV